MTEEEKKSTQQKQQEQPEAAQIQAKKKSNKTLFIILGVVLGLFLLGTLVVGAGLFFVGRKVMNEASKIKKTGSNTYQYEDKKTGTKLEAGEDVEKPDDWPDDVAVYEGKLTYATSGGEGKGLSLGIATDDDASAIKEYYVKNLKDEGWKKISESNYSGTTSFSYEKDKRNVSVLIMKDTSDKSRNLINITVISIK